MSHYPNIKFAQTDELTVNILFPRLMDFYRKHPECHESGEKFAIGSQEHKHFVDKHALRNQPLNWKSDGDLAMTLIPDLPSVTGLWTDSKYLLSLFFQTKPYTQKFRGEPKIHKFCNFNGLGGYSYHEAGHAIKHLKC